MARPRSDVTRLPSGPWRGADGVAEGERKYWLTDLDGVHPVKKVTRERVIGHMRQLVHHVGFRTATEAKAVCESHGEWRDEELAEALTTVG